MKGKRKTFLKEVDNISKYYTKESSNATFLF